MTRISLIIAIVAALAVGVDHPEYSVSTGSLPEAVRASLASDLR